MQFPYVSKFLLCSYHSLPAEIEFGSLNPFSKCSIEPKPQYPDGFKVAFMQMMTCFCFCFPDSCRNRPSRTPRKPLRPNKASRQLPPEPNQMETDEVKRVLINTVLQACVVLALPQNLLRFGEFHHFLYTGKYLP